MGGWRRPPSRGELPSGDEVVTWRVVVARDPTNAPSGADGRSGPTVDTLDCAAWRAGVRRQALRWREGDVVEIEGAVHRRYYRTGAGQTVSRHEIVAHRVRRLGRAPADERDPA
ncbi:MAG: single-stranded DNA-binding protein [Streptosporangiales bacterium]|nr:single-stranded DNA-binding protein [Streptosporangiales bacterium]